MQLVPAHPNTSRKMAAVSSDTATTAEARLKSSRVSQIRKLVRGSKARRSGKGRWEWTVTTTLPPHNRPARMPGIGVGQMGVHDPDAFPADAGPQSLSSPEHSRGTARAR